MQVSQGSLNEEPMGPNPYKEKLRSLSLNPSPRRSNTVREETDTAISRTTEHSTGQVDVSITPKQINVGGQIATFKKE